MKIHEKLSKNMQGIRQRLECASNLPQRVLKLRIVGVNYFLKAPLFILFWMKLRILGEILPDDFEFLSYWSQIAGNL
jgi:hypothetical protein